MGSVRYESQTVTVRICYHHFSGPPWSVLGRFNSGNASTSKFTIAVVNIGNYEVDRATPLTVSSMFRQKNNLIFPGQLYK